MFDVQGQRLEGTEAEEFKDQFDDFDYTKYSQYVDSTVCFKYI